MAIARAPLPRRMFVLALLAVWATSSIAFASDVRPVPLEERLHGADVVVVATASAVAPSWRNNEFGDRLIVSRYELQVQETLKGMTGRTLSLDVEGGSLDGFTLRVSSVPTLVPGERAVFLLDAGNGAYHSHLKGLGILKLDEHDLVRGSSLTLDEVRRVAAAGAKP